MVTTNTIMTSQGGSYNARSFLRSSLVVNGGEKGTVRLVFSRGTGVGDLTTLNKNESKVIL